MKELIRQLSTANPDACVEIETEGYGIPEHAIEVDVRATGTFVTLMGETPFVEKAGVIPDGKTTDEANGEPKYGDPGYDVSEFSDVAKAVAAKRGITLPPSPLTLETQTTGVNATSKTLTHDDLTIVAKALRILGGNYIEDNDPGFINYIMNMEWGLFAAAEHLGGRVLTIESDRVLVELSSESSEQDFEDAVECDGSLGKWFAITEQELKALTCTGGYPRFVGIKDGKISSAF